MIRRTPRAALAALLLGIAAPPAAHAEGWQCWADVSSRYNIPVDLLYAIARVESGNKARIVSAPNKNGTYDIGLMQINSAHLPRLAKYGISKQMLLDDPCLNLHVGAWILADNVARHGYNWRAVGAYNAAVEDKRIKYARKVLSLAWDSANKKLQPVVADPAIFETTTSATVEVAP